MRMIADHVHQEAAGYSKHDGCSVHIDWDKAISPSGERPTHPAPPCFLLRGRHSD